jgi:hypothetical protein
MTDTIYTGLTYGFMAGFTVFGFILTGFVLWGLIEVLHFILEWITSRGSINDEKRRGGDGGWD